jgi:hypothetical protein
MVQPTVLVRAALPQGYRWKVVVDGQSVATGTAASEMDARTAADEIAKRIAAEPPQGP